MSLNSAPRDQVSAKMTLQRRHISRKGGRGEDVRQALWSVIMQRCALLLVTLRAMPHGEVCMVPAAGGGPYGPSSLAPAFVVNGTNQGREVARPTPTSSGPDRDDFSRDPFDELPPITGGGGG